MNVGSNIVKNGVGIRQKMDDARTQKNTTREKLTIKKPFFRGFIVTRENGNQTAEKGCCKNKARSAEFKKNCHAYYFSKRRMAQPSHILPEPLKLSNAGGLDFSGNRFG